MLIRVTPGDANRFVFSKQHLASGSRGHDVMSVIRDVGPIRATPALVPYLSLWSRIEGFQREQLDAALYDLRTLVRVPCMHARLHLLAAELWPAYYRVLRPLLRHGLGDLDELLTRSDGPSAEPTMASAELAQRVMEVLSTRGPASIAELAELLPILGARMAIDPDHPEITQSSLSSLLIPAMCAEGMLIRTRTQGGWRSDLFAYSTVSSWLPALDLHALDDQEALRQVVLSYIAAYGPVTTGDIAYWLGELPRHRVAAMLMDLGRSLVRVQVVGTGGESFLLREQLPSLLNAPSGERSVSLLPPRDSLLLAYADTSRLLPAVYRERAYDRAGEALGTVWLDGGVIGLWWLQVKEERVVVRFFELMDPEVLAMVGEEARALCQFMDFALSDVEIGCFLEDTTEEGTLAPALTTGLEH